MKKNKYRVLNGEISVRNVKCGVWCRCHTNGSNRVTVTLKAWGLAPLIFLISWTCLFFFLLLCREERAGSERAEPVQLFWKADEKSVHQIDDGNSSKSFSFGMYGSMYSIYSVFLWYFWHILLFNLFPLLFADRVFTAKETTNQLYQAIAKPIVVSTVEGYNGM